MRQSSLLYELLDRLAAQRGKAALISSEELTLWPSNEVSALKKHKLLRKTRPASSVVCSNCEEECVRPVYSEPGHERTPRLFLVCEKQSDVNQIEIAIEQLEQWQACGDFFANLTGELLGLRKPNENHESADRWKIGLFKGNKNASHAVLLAGDTLSLSLAGHSIVLADVLTLEGSVFSIDTEILTRLVDNPVSEPHNKQKPKSLPTHSNTFEHTNELEVGSPEWRRQTAQNAANARHNQPGGSRDKQQKMRDIWATGKYSSRDRCAEEECGALGISFSSARKALRNTPAQ